MEKKNVLLICGGGGAEHDVSLVSASYFLEKLKEIDFISPHWVEIGKDSIRRDSEGRHVELRKSGELIRGSESIFLHFAIPCFHGYPGETGDIQSVFEMMNLPYLGSNSEASKSCFNKVTTKLWLNALGIPNTPFIFLKENTKKELDLALNFFDESQQVFVKAASQGSSIGTYEVLEKDALFPAISKAFEYSPYVLLEKRLHARELEVSAFEYDGELRCSLPGEILSKGAFYSYEEKYESKGKTKTELKAQNLSKEVLEKIELYSKLIFKGLKLKDLARIDFFYTKEAELYVNEINTFPGHTNISMFPTMLEATGVQYTQFLKNIIQREGRHS